MITIYKFFGRIFGFRFHVWASLTFLALLIFIVALVLGVFSNHGMVRAGPSVLVVGFAMATFLLLVPFGYLVENFKEAISLRYVGWIYFLYVASVFLLVGYGIWLHFSQYISGSVGALEAGGKLFAGMIFLSAYTWLSIPLAVVLAIFRKRD